MNPSESSDPKPPKRTALLQVCFPRGVVSYSVNETTKPCAERGRRKGFARLVLCTSILQKLEEDFAIIFPSTPKNLELYLVKKRLVLILKLSLR